ncbi:MAG: hypothetical protein HYV35_09195 [Lentisphaerae bacterium]|nr:hypothetical protein [Lentisphaerota bacterium]
MKNDKIIVKCCICRREQTGKGWQYSFRINESNRVYAHGFCSVCYDAAAVRAKLYQVASVVPVLR